MMDRRLARALALMMLERLLARAQASVAAADDALELAGQIDECPCPLPRPVHVGDRLELVARAADCLALAHRLLDRAEELGRAVARSHTADLRRPDPPM